MKEALGWMFSPFFNHINKTTEVKAYMRFKVSVPVIIVSTFVALTGYAMLGSKHVPGFHWLSSNNTLPGDTGKHTLHDRYGNYSTDENEHNPFNLMPKNYKVTTDYNPDSNTYNLNETIGDQFYRDPSEMSFEDYLQYVYGKDENDYWMKKRDASQLLDRKSVVPTLHKANLADRLFGGSNVDIRPSGNVDLTFGGNYQNIQNPILTQQQRHQGGFNFDMNIQMNVVGTIGDKLKLNASYNTKAQFDFENLIKLQYAGHQDDIIKNIQAGNVSFPLNSQLIQGPQNLFGLKTKMQFGRLTATGIVSQKKSQTKTLTIQGGQLTTPFTLMSSDYDENKNFFLGQFFRNTYEKALSQLPIIRSEATITKIQVWVTNTQGSVTNVRNIVAFTDMGESKQSDISATGAHVTAVGNGLQSLPPYATLNGSPKSLNTLNSNNLYSVILQSNPNFRSNNNVIQQLAGAGFVQVQDFEATYARELAPSEFTYNAQLGFISVNAALGPSDVLAVAYQYTYNGRVYQVGDFAEDVTPNPNNPNVLWLKLLKGTAQQPKQPMWKLMMRNVYSLNAYSISQDGFRLDVNYEDPGGTQRRYIPVDGINGTPLISLMNLDNLNGQNEPVPDGLFDFIPGTTILTTNGKIIFPVLEPFGNHLTKEIKKLCPAAQVAADTTTYVYQQLYDSTKTVALEFPQYNRYVIKGQYKSSSGSDISLGGFNIPRGSVKVSAGGQQLVENTDFTVDYNLGRLKILNQSILSSGIPIQVSFENNDLFGFNLKTVFGARFDYVVNDKLQLGATIMHLTQRPYTTKLLVGDDPISNTVAGLDARYFTDAPGITRFLNHLPNISTKDKSSITLTGEIARFQPGHPKIIGKAGTVYIDDFEGAETTYDLKFPFVNWALSSTPQNSVGPGNANMFPEGSLLNDLSYGYRRSHLSWYTIDPMFQQANISSTPSYISSDTTSATGCSNIYLREYYQTDLFPALQVQPGLPTNLPTFDLFFDPKTRGPYNFQTVGFDRNGHFINRSDKFAGISRSLDYTDFEAANVEFVQFWIVDPFYYNHNPNAGGELYVNLGEISEDVLRDSKQFYENGLPNTSLTGNTVPVTKSKWGRVATNIPIVPGVFDNDPATRAYQDVGFDGLPDDSEVIFHADYLAQLAANLPGGKSNPLYQKALADPSGDDFHYILGSDYDNAKVPALARYNQWNGTENNSPVSSTNLNYSPSSTNLPDVEDLNRDNTMVETEQYFQYKVDIKPGSLVVGQNFVTDKQVAPITLCNGRKENVTFYQIKIPIESYNARVGSISDFKSIRFMRMYLTGFSDSVYLRFATMELIRNQWRKYQYSLLQPGEYLPNDNTSNTYFNVAEVNLEENATKTPVNYVVPPGIQRQQLVSATGTYLQNEQSMDLQVCNLQDGDARAVYKNITLDLRHYKRLRMFTHAEAAQGQALKDGDLTAILRIGSDFVNNYYEFEIPLRVTKPGSYQNDGDHDAREVWPDANEFNILLDSLTYVKEERNAKNYTTLATYTISRKDGTRLTVIGNPDLAAATVIMLGVRNPKRGYLSPQFPEDDGLPKCADVWFDELRLTDFDEKGGWAGVGNATVKLANFGTATLNGNFHTPGYGQLEQQLNDRYLDYFYQYNATTTLQLGQLLGKAVPISLPMFAGISESFSIPEYDPNNLDIPFEGELRAIHNAHIRDSMRKAAETYTGIKSLNFTNVRLKGGKNPKIWALSNFNLTFAYTQTLKSTPDIQHDNTNMYHSELGYAYAGKGMPIKPFAHLSKSKWLKLVTDFNVNPVPTSINFRTSVDRMFEEILLRPVAQGDVFDPNYNKYFKNARVYGIKFDITKSINADFNATANALIDEPYGHIDSQQKKDSLWHNIRTLGRVTDYNHAFNISYNVPFNKFPLLDWIQASAHYSSTFSWISAPLVRDSVTNKLIYSTLGNTIGNTQNIQLSGELTMRTLYNKVKFFKKIDSYNSPKKPTSSVLKPGLKGEKPPAPSIKDPKAKKEEKISPPLVFATRLLLSLKRVSFSYTQNSATTIPGFLPRPNAAGENLSSAAPGLNFLFGYQPDSNWLQRAGRQGWMTKDTSLNYPLIQNVSKNYTGRMSLEPLKDFTLDLNWTSTNSLNTTEYFRFNDAMQQFQIYNPVQTGTYTISFIMWKTAFKGFDKLGFSKNYDAFSDNRLIVAKRLASSNPLSEGYKPDSSGVNYPVGYNGYSQDVLLPSFFAGYTGQNANNVKLNTLHNFPLPNWRIAYSGLGKIPFVRKWFNSINLTHAYSSTYSVSSYTSSLNYQGVKTVNGLVEGAKDTTSGNFIPYYTISQILLTEQFSPLLGVDAVLKNNISVRFQYNRSRSIALSLLNYQVSETYISGITTGLGYKWKKAPIPFKVNGMHKRLKNDINIKMDVSYNNNITDIYRIDENYHQATQGTETITISPTADYMVNKNFTLQFFFTKVYSIPHTSLSYPITTTRFGITLRFTLQ